MYPESNSTQVEFDNLNKVGLRHFTKEDYELALRYFLDAFRLRPYAFESLFNIARTMDEMKNPLAEDFYVAAVTQGSVDALYQLGAFYVSAGREEEAVEPLRAFVKASTEHGDSFVRDAKANLDRIDPRRLKIVWRR